MSFCLSVYTWNKDITMDRVKTPEIKREPSTPWPVSGHFTCKDRLKPQVPLGGSTGRSTAFDSETNGIYSLFPLLSVTWIKNLNCLHVIGTVTYHTQESHPCQPALPKRDRLGLYQIQDWLVSNFFPSSSNKRPKWRTAFQKEQCNGEANLEPKSQLVRLLLYYPMAVGKYLPDLIFLRVCDSTIWYL